MPSPEFPDAELPAPAGLCLRATGLVGRVQLLNLWSLSSPCKALARGLSLSHFLCLYLGCFYGFNLNKGFLISCLRSCQSEKFLYYMRLEVLELSRLPNTQHHYPGCPLSLSAGAPAGSWGHVCYSGPAASLPPLQLHQDLHTATSVSLFVID